MDAARSWVGIIVVMSYPVGLLLWVVIHPFAAFWRRLGTAWTYGILSIPSLAYMVVVFLMRKKILARDFGTQYLLVGLAFVFMIIGILLSLKRRKYLNFSRLSGIPELSEKQYPGKLLTDGPYARIRNPRYIEAAFFTLGYVVFANYLVPYIMFLLSLPVLFLVVILEEKELLQRFGKEYEEYCQRVPRFIPKRENPESKKI